MDREIVVAPSVMIQKAGDQPLSQRIVETVADADDIDPTEVKRLSAVIDPDALDMLFRPQRKVGEVPDATAEVRFTYHGYEVCATATGRVTLTEHG